MNRLLNILLIVLSFAVTSAHALDKDQEIADKLVGIWGMEPLTSVSRGAANVTEYKADGTYKLHAFKCKHGGEFIREKENDTAGTWRIEDSTILTDHSDPELQEQIAEIKRELNQELAKLPPEKRDAFLKLLPPDIQQAMNDGDTISKERVLSISDNEFSSDQDWIAGTKLKYKNHRLEEIKPLCDDF